MTQYYILYKKKNSKQWSNSIKVGSNKTKDEIRKNLRKGMKSKAYSTRIVTKSQLLKLLKR